MQIEMIGDLATALSEIVCNQSTRQSCIAAHTMLHSAKRILFIGNGGSAAIASHMAIDYMKFAGVPTLAFNDAPMITMIANDYWFGEVFAKQIERHRQDGDVLVAISSSGRSENIIKGVKAFQDMQHVITLSGFTYDNPLRTMGAINFWINSRAYGVVEIASLSILHSLVEP